MVNKVAMIDVEVAYARPEKQVLKQLRVPLGSTAMEAVKQSGVLDIFPEIDTSTQKIGIFSQVLGTKGLDEPAVYLMRQGDRVEIYRPLVADPKEVRRRRAQQAKLDKATASSR